MADMPNPEKLLQRQLLDVLISAGLVACLVFLCFKILSPFLTMLLWAVVLAVTLYPLHQLLAKKLAGNQGRAAVAMMLIGILMIGTPVTFLSISLAESVTSMAKNVDASTLVIPAPPANVADWPLVGDKVHAVWTAAATNLPDLIQKMRPAIGDMLKSGLGFFAHSVTGLLMFLFSFAIAGIIMVYGREGAASARRISRRFMGPERGDRFAALSTATIRTVATGVIGVAFIQAVLMGLIMGIAGIPFAGVLAVVAMVLGVAQVPLAVVALPVIAYIWLGGGYAMLPAVIYTVLLLASGLVDNVLKPLLLGRGVDAPMPVILLGALGGMVAGGLLGMFLGAVMLALGYQMFMGWVAMQDPIEAPPREDAA
ncbi:MAG: AI-2E family transporter [Arenimonas sp.]|nr:AI-2E family transporter [Arenimonas sp.]MBP7981658.1 AI-2E family transporter [Arenimonas sp.]